MKNFTIGLISGISLYIFIQYFFPNISLINSNSSISQEATVIKKQKTLNSEVELNIKSVTLDASSSDGNTKNNTNKHIASDVTRSKSIIHDEISDLRQEVSNLALKINDEKLAIAIQSLNEQFQPPPEEIFSSESRDEVLSSIKEDSLELNFYKYQPYSELADLQSVECKITICKIKLVTPFNAVIDKSKLQKFSGNIILSKYGMKDENDQVLMTIYIGADDD